MVEKIIEWLIFGIILALVPLGLYWLISYILNQSMSYEQTIAKGELFIIAAGLCGASLSKLLMLPKSKKYGVRLGLGGISVVTLLLSAALYSIVSIPNLLRESPDVTATMITSTVIYVLALIINGISVCVGEISHANDI